MFDVDFPVVSSFKPLEIFKFANCN